MKITSASAIGVLVSSIKVPVILNVSVNLTAIGNLSLTNCVALFATLIIADAF